VENYVRVLNIGMVSKEWLRTLQQNSYINQAFDQSERPSKPKSTGATADRKNKNSKPSGNRAKASGSRAQIETSAKEGQSINSNAQGSDHDPRVSASLDLSESSNRLDGSKDIIQIAKDFRVLILNRIRNYKRTFSIFQERPGYQGSLDRACGQHLRI
jgi:hypothetical protein